MTTFPSKSLPNDDLVEAGNSLPPRVLAEFGVARFKDQVFDAVLALWRKRQEEGWTQKKLANAIGRDKSWVSKSLRAPGNWTVRTAGELISALEGEADIVIYAIEDSSGLELNEDAYTGYLEQGGDHLISQSTQLCENFVMISVDIYTKIDPDNFFITFGSKG